jgi:hypothetical protein
MRAAIRIVPAVATALFGLILSGATAMADDREWKDEYRDSAGEHKYGSKPGEWKEEHKGHGREHKYEAKADGEWKEEYKDGRCEVKRERKKDGEYKEEVKCQ